MERVKKNVDWFEGFTIQERREGKEREHGEEKETNCSLIFGCSLKVPLQVFMLGSPPVVQLTPLLTN